MITLTKHNYDIKIMLECNIINTSAQTFDLKKLSHSINEQIASVFNKKIGKYNVTVQTNITLITNERQCSLRKILFHIVDTIKHNNPAEADFKGLRIKLNKNTVEDISSNTNTRTIPHEIGHLFGWDHPHANAQFESINPTAHALEKQLSEKERQFNLMSQTWYAQRANTPLNQAIEITEQQIALLLHYYYSNALNKNRHLKYFLWWRKLLISF